MRLRLFVAAGLVALVGFSFTTVRVFADDGSQTATPTTTSAKPTFNREAAEQKAAEAKAKAQAELEVKKSEAQERTKEAREKSCEARKSAAENRLNNAKANAQKHKEKFDSIIERVDQFVEKKNLSTDGLTEQRGAVSSAAEETQTAVEGLSTLIGNADCSNPDALATTLTNVKSQMELVKSDLSAYRTAIRTYMQAVKSSVTNAETTKTEGVN